MRSDWKSCKNDPPLPYIRIEIKDKKNKKYIGFYTTDKVYLTSVGKEIIKQPKYWRYLRTPDETWDGVKLGWLFPSRQEQDVY